MTKQGAQNVRKAVRKSNFTTALDAIDETFDHYITYDNGEDINKASVDEFLSKIGGYLYINSLPPVEKEMYHVLNCCKARFRYWDQPEAKRLVLEYIDALREQGWSDDQILEDLKKELLRVSNEKKNWSEWKGFVLKWISDIKGWGKEKGTIQSSVDRLRYEGTKLTDTLDIDINFANEAFQVIKLFYDHFSGSTPEGWIVLSTYIEDALMRFLLDMREEFHLIKGIPIENASYIDDYIDSGSLYNLIHTFPIDDEFIYHPMPKARPSDFPRDVQHHFLATDCDNLIKEIFDYFYLPSCRLDYESCLNAIDYFIKHYKEVFIIPEK